MTKRIMGKASFIHLQDSSGKIQLFIKKDNIKEDYDKVFKELDIGDIIGVNGTLFKTKTGELTVMVDNLRLLVKSLQPLPDKFHGLNDQEIRYRKRYLDLIMNNDIKELFKYRSNIIEKIRRFFLKHNFMEVETPMMQSIPGGAVAKPFITHHNALNIPLYLRIAPELYLKRLVIGGFERVFEINKSFRNEGLSTKHNPEFTMIEFYQAYADYRDLIGLTINLLKELTNGEVINYQGKDIDFSDYNYITFTDAILKYNKDLDHNILMDKNKLINILGDLNIKIDNNSGSRNVGLGLDKNDFNIYKMWEMIFNKTVEDKLIQPTFITDFPTAISPLARRRDDNKEITERFELYIAGYEIANGFSELNDVDDQASRFKLQCEDKDDSENIHYDKDYINALEYGLPPTAGEGIGIDRLVMLLTNQASIKDVILFPLMKKDL